MNIKKELAYFEAHCGISFEEQPKFYIEPEWRNRDHGDQIAMDAQPTLVSTANAGIPSLLTTFIDPEALRINQSPNEAAEIFGEQNKGTWTDAVAMFPVVENSGTVSAYGDYSNAGRSDVNTEWENRESFLFQTILGYGDLEVAKATLGRIALVSEKQQSAVKALAKYKNKSYFFGIANLQNYGLLNDPSLLPAIAPALKAAGGNRWVLNSAIVGTANEIYNDIQSLWLLVIKQAGGQINTKAKAVLAMSPQSEGALTATNQYGKTVIEMMQKTFPNMVVKTAVQYGALSGFNTEGSAAGEMMQLIVEDVEGQKTGYCASNASLRMGRIIPALSSFEQKAMSGTFGAVVRQPFAIASMIGL